MLKTIKPYFNKQETRSSVNTSPAPVDPHPVQSPAGIIGALDGLTDGELCGWAFDPNARATPVTIRLAIDGIAIAEVPANQYRADLAQLGYRDGYADLCRLCSNG